MKKQRIAVLGAGPMGLAAAYQLALDGHQPIVFEADDRLGGMTACFDFGNLRIERFYHFHCSTDSAFLRMLDELGLADRLHWRSTKMGYFIDGQVVPWGSPLALLRFGRLSLFDKFRFGLHALSATRRNDWSALDRLDAQTWMRSWVGDEAFDVLWKQLFDQKFHHHANHLSAAWIWSRIRRLGRSRDAFFRERLGFLEGGSETLLNAMRDAIVARGGEIRLSTPVERVVIEDGCVKGVVTNGRVETFDRCVSTIPLPYVPGVFRDLPEEILGKIRSLPYIAVVCVILKLRRKVSENFWLNVSDPSIDVPGVIEYTNLRPLRDRVVYVPYYVPFEHPVYSEPNETIIARVKGYLKQINPDLSDDDFLDARASRYRYAQPICEPGFLDRLPPIDLPIEGLVLADTAYYYPEDRGISESIDLGRRMAKMVTACSNTISRPNSCDSSSRADSPPE